MLPVGLRGTRRARLPPSVMVRPSRGAAAPAACGNLGCGAAARASSARRQRKQLNVSGGLPRRSSASTPTARRELDSARLNSRLNALPLEAKRTSRAIAYADAPELASVLSHPLLADSQELRHR